MKRNVLAWGERILNFLEISVFRHVFVLLSFVAIGALLFSRWEEIGQSLIEIKWSFLLAATIPGMIFVFTGVLVWTSILIAMEPTVEVGNLRRSFFLGQLSKYLPGGFWNFFSVSAFAKSSGAGRKSLLLSQAYTMFVSIGTGLILGGGLLLFNDGSGAGLIWLGAVFALTGVGAVVAVLLAVGSKTFDGRHRNIRIGGISLSTKSLGAAGWALFGWFFAGIHVTLLTLALETPLTLSMTLSMILGFSIAWALGAATPFAPSGIGIREVIFFAFASLHLSIDESVIVVASSRLILLIIDLMFGMVSSFYRPVKRSSGNSRRRGAQLFRARRWEERAAKTF